MLSVLVHALLFLLLWLIPWPQAQPTPAFIVIDVGTPALAEMPVDAPTVGDPAPQAPVPQVADPQTGEPQAPSVETPAPTRQPEPLAEALQPRPVQVEAAETAPPPPPPAPQVRVPEPTASVPPVDIPLAEAPRTALPEIDEVRLEPRPLPQAIVLPTPVVTAVVPEARVITATPSVQVTPEQALPQPEVRVAVAEVRPLAVTPQVEVAVARPVEVVPQVQVAEARSLAVVPQVEVAAAVAVPSPQVAVEVRLPAAVEAAVEEPVVEAPVGAQETIATAEQPGGALETAAAQAASPRELNRPAGGNADQAGQTRDQADAQLQGLGAAASPDGVRTPTGVPARRVLEPFSDQRFRPLAVVVDNANGFPQSGFLEASAIYEFPIEGGLTRLMMIYDRIDPASVGPVRSARDYMVAAARSLDGILVHDGGAPSAMHAIANENLTTFNAFNRGELFARAGGRSAPYNLYSSGSGLRQAINTLRLEQVRNLRTQRYRPAEDAPAATSVQVRFSGAYSGGFSFNPVLNHYRWQRNGQSAADANGQSVVVEVVVIARIVAQPIPGDPQGRLFVRLEEGEATLLIRGKRIEGRWREQNGVSFFSNDGEQIDLAPFKHWVMFVPNWAQVTIE